MNFSFQKRSTLILGVSLLAPLLAFLGFYVIFSASVSEYIKEFTAACIGALITIAATAALLKSQTAGEIKKEQLTNTFQLKLSMYSSFIDHINIIHKDDSLTLKEINSTIDWAIKLSLISSPSVVRTLHDYLMQVIAFGSFKYDDLSPEAHAAWLRYIKTQDDSVSEETEHLDVYFSSYGHLVYSLREDLACVDHQNEDENIETMDTINRIRNMRGAKSIIFDENNVIQYNYK